MSISVPMAMCRRLSRSRMPPNNRGYRCTRSGTCESSISRCDFRFDGLRAQNMCRDVTLEKVNCLNNGRAGIAVSGTSRIEMVGGSLSENGRHSLLVSSPATANLREVTTDVEPTVIPK